VSLRAPGQETKKQRKLLTIEEKWKLQGEWRTMKVGHLCVVASMVPVNSNNYNEKY
jgi:hypothetical protein